MAAMPLGGRAHAASRPGSPHPASARTLLANRGLRRVLAADFLMAGAWNANTFVLPIHGAHHGWSAAAVGDALGAFGAAVLVARILPAAWTRALGDWRAIRLALAVSGLCFAALPFAHRLPWACALEALMGLGLGRALASVLTLLHAQAPRDRGAEVLGLRLVVLNVSAVGLPLGLGALGASIGFASFLAVCGGGLVLCAARLRSREPRERGPRHARAPSRAA
jgi:predicted MFS family arabinose efflux permease